MRIAHLFAPWLLAAAVIAGGAAVWAQVGGGGVSKQPVQQGDALTATTGNFSGQIISTVSTGTAPFVVASTTNVAHLNASSLGGATFAAPGTIGGTTPGAGHFTTLSATGQITSTLATGTAPLVIASTTNVPNLNASSLGGATFAAPGPIGGTTPGAGNFTALSATGAAQLAETHSNAYSPTLTANNYTLQASDCGKTLKMTGGTTGATVGLFNWNPTDPTEGCAIAIEQDDATQYVVTPAGGATFHSVNSYTMTKGQYATIVLWVRAPNASATDWVLTGDGA